MTNNETSGADWTCVRCGKQIPAGYAHVCVSNNYYYQCPPLSSPAQKPVYAFSDQGEELLKRLDALTRQMAELTRELKSFVDAM